MAGGIFTGRPFALNIKCIIFTLVVAGGYWYLPPKNKYILLLLLWLPYVTMAWYDYSYNCEDKMQPTIFPFGRYIFLPFKPQGYKDEFSKMTKEQIEAMEQLDHIVGYTIIAGVALYIIQKYY